MQYRFLRKRGAAGGCPLPLGGAVAQRLRGVCTVTPPVAYGDSPLWDGALGIAGKLPGKLQSLPYRKGFPRSGEAVTAGD